MKAIKVLQNRSISIESQPKKVVAVVVVVVVVVVLFYYWSKNLTLKFGQNLVNKG